MSGKYIAYLRVSTEGQGAGGLGVSAQRKAVSDYLNGGSRKLLGEYVEVESGKQADRPQLVRAMAHCRLTGATLVVAKLDRLSRNLAFLANLMDGGSEFVACDNPHATKFTLHILAAVAEHERTMISDRTKAALAAAKARGKKLGGWRGGPVVDGRLGGEAARKAADARAAEVAPTMRGLMSEGCSLRQIARTLASRGIRTPRGGEWTATAVRNALARVTA